MSATVAAPAAGEILERVLDGERLSDGDAAVLLRSRDLVAVGRVANEIRSRKVDPERVTFIVDRNINYTNVCVYKCRFCAFYRPPGDPEGYLVPFEEIGRKIEETLALHGTGILLQGGVHPDLPLQYYLDLLGFIRERYPTIHRHAFSPPEVKFLAKKERLSFAEVIGRLKEAGLMSIPGGIILGTLLDELERRKLGTGLATLCVGGGMGIATIIERV